MKAEDYQVRPVISGLFKGRTGTGKTIAACGKEFRPVYVLDCEGRMNSVVTYYKQLDGHCRDIEFDTFDMEGGFYPMDKKMDELIARCDYKTVHVASLTSYIHIVLYHLIKAKAGQKTSRGFDAVRRIGGIPVNSLEDYNAEDAAIIYELLRFLKSLHKQQGVNTFLEAHISPYEIISLEEGQRVSTTYNQIVTKGKKAPAQIPGYFDEVYLFTKTLKGMGSSKGGAYEFDSTGTSTDDCKTSLGINGFDWTGKDFSVELMKQISNEVKDTPRIDPNQPKTTRF